MLIKDLFQNVQISLKRSTLINMKQTRIYITFTLLLIGIILYNYLNSNSFINNMKTDYFPKEISGTIYDATPIKGGVLSIEIHSNSKDDGISIRNSDMIFKNIKNGTYLKKIPNTNKCFIIKGDSIMYFNCYVFSKEDSAKIGKIKNWNLNLTNHWILKK